MIERKIEVLVTPHPHDNKENPFFWAVVECDGRGSWHNIGSGWAKSPLDAYAAAEAHHNAVTS